MLPPDREFTVRTHAVNLHAALDGASPAHETKANAGSGMTRRPQIQRRPLAAFSNLDEFAPAAMNARITARSAWR
jgi:hypothetical protein